MPTGGTHGGRGTLPDEEGGDAVMCSASLWSGTKTTACWELGVLLRPAATAPGGGGIVGIPTGAVATQACDGLGDCDACGGMANTG